MLRSLTLSNFQKHKDLAVDFTSGLNLVVGRNWAGKTTIQRAVLYALFGTSAVPGKAAGLVHQSEQTMEVVLAFELADQLYTVQRGTKGAILRRDGEPEVVASGQTAVTVAIESLLGISAKDFIAFQVARQNEAASILTLGAPKLNAHMESVCGVTLVDQAVKWLREKVTEAKSITTQAELMRDRLDTLAQERPALLGAVDQAQKVHAEYLEQGEAARKIVQNLTAEVRRLNDSVTEFSARRQARDTLYELLSKLPDVPAPDPDEIARLEGQLEALKARSAVFVSAGQARQLRLREVQAAQQAAHAAKLAAPAEIVSVEKIEEQYSIATSDTAQARAAYNAAVSERDSSACHACGRPFEDARDAASLEALVSATQVALSNCLEQEATLKRALAEARAAARAEEAHLVALQRLYEAHDRLEQTPEPEPVDETQIAELTARSSALSMQARQHAERARVLEQWYALPELGPDEGETLKAARQALETQRSASNALDNEALRAEFALTEAQGALRRADTEAEELAERARAMSGEIELSKLRKQLADVLVDNRESFMAGAWQRLLFTASEFAGAATEGSLSSLQRENDSFFFYEAVEDSTECRPIELASGHQQAVLGVGVKLALTQAVGAPFDVVLLDEVSAGATDELSLMMTKAIKEQTGQCLLISHRQADTALADRVISL